MRWLATAVSVIVGFFLVVAIVVAGSGHSHCVLKNSTGGERCINAGTTGGWPTVVVAVAILAVVAATALVIKLVLRTRVPS
jgi:hypothetical protein